MTLQTRVLISGTNQSFLQSEEMLFPEYDPKFEVFNILYVVGRQMVMEFSDSAMDVDSHELNTSRWKQFSEVMSFNFTNHYT